MVAPLSPVLTTLILGVIEGITEFLPISSTGHLLIAEEWLGERSELFNVAIQAGAILAIVLIYWRRILALFTRLDLPANRDYFLKLCFAVAVTILGMLIPLHYGFRLPENVFPVAVALILGGAAIIAIEHYVAHKPVREEVTWAVALAVGLGQIVAAIFPGTSRSAATIFAAMLVGLTSRPAATEFAFLAGIPTMFAATAYELWKVRHATAGEDWGALALGFVASAVVAFAAVKWLLRYIQTHRFTVFAYYRFVLGGFLLILIAVGRAH